MSLIHEKMYQTEELSKINIEEYFRSLARDLIHSYQIQFEVKTNIEEFSKSALDIINSIDIVSFRYEHADEYLKVGIIADDSPEEITTKAHDQMIIPTTIGLAMKAIQELDKKLLTLQ
jgi:hypothetical protein